jgi:hypothetical protein
MFQTKVIEKLETDILIFNCRIPAVCLMFREVNVVDYAGLLDYGIYIVSEL